MTSLLALMLVVLSLCYLAIAAPLGLKTLVIQPTSISFQESFEPASSISIDEAVTLTVVGVVDQPMTTSSDANIPDASGTTVSLVSSETSTAAVTSTVVVTETRTETIPTPSGTSSTASTASTPSQATSTVTEVVTVTQPASSTTWSAPAQMTDLSSFNTSHFGGSENLRIVNGIPANASATPTLGISTVTVELPAPTGVDNITSDASPSSQVVLPVVTIKNPPPPYKPWSNDTSVLQLFYPKGSINPGQRPQGGAQFYAQPLDVTSARNVSMEYSVFFPRDFDWVLAGKLPGLYGGHVGCSGGVDALDCFSTRLMWRQNGAGELYLYAPRDKQTKALCSDSRSVCNDDYGMSIGRGSFKWAVGAWTTVRQTVVLNTPGEQDGWFVLEVDGKRVIERRDVFYRDVPPPPPPPPSDSDTDSGSDSGSDSGKSRKAQPAPGSDKDGLSKSGKGNNGAEGGDSSHNDGANGRGSGSGGLLGLGLGGLLRREPNMINGASISDTSVSATATIADRTGDLVVVTNGEDGNRRAQQLWKISEVDSVSVDGDEVNVAEDESDGVELLSMSSVNGGGSGGANLPVGFAGLFFSTFFGGHEPEYATPKDQYAWFKDFSMVYND